MKIFFVVLLLNLTSDILAQQRGTGLYLRAPDTMPGTIPEMRKAEYWISKMNKPDEVLLTVGAIKSRNKDYVSRMANPGSMDSILRKQVEQDVNSRPGLIAALPDIYSKTPVELGNIAKDMVGKEIRFLKRRSWGNILSIQYSGEEINSIENEMAFSKIDSQVKILTGITVKDCRLRIIPATRPEYVGNTGVTGWDMWNLDILPIARPVQVLHISKSGAFLFVLSERGYGWVNSDEIAIADRKEVYNITNAKSFIVCTGERIAYYADNQTKLASGFLRMGDKLPSDGKDARIIKVPVRNTNGTLSMQQAWLATGADISRNYLPYTRKNIVMQAFKLLDNIYDWTSGWYGRDHATSLRDIFSVFGFEFPSMGGMMAAYNPAPLYIFPKEGTTVQYKAMISNEAFATIQVCGSGHSQLYLGHYEGMPIVFDTHGYRYPDANGNDLYIRRANIGTILFPDYFLKQSISFIKLY